MRFLGDRLLWDKLINQHLWSDFSPVNEFHREVSMGLSLIGLPLGQKTRILLRNSSFEKALWEDSMNTV